MTDIKLTDNQWIKIRKFLFQDPNAYVGKDEACRKVVEAVKWVSRSGAQWRLLPSEYGYWNTIYKRFASWCKAGVWQRMFDYFVDDPDMENGMIDSTVVRAVLATPLIRSKLRRFLVRQPYENTCDGVHSALGVLELPRQSEAVNLMLSEYLD